MFDAGGSRSGSWRLLRESGHRPKDIAALACFLVGDPTSCAAGALQKPISESKIVRFTFYIFRFTCLFLILPGLGPLPVLEKRLPHLLGEVPALGPIRFSAELHHCGQRGRVGWRYPPHASEYRELHEEQVETADCDAANLLFFKL